MPTEMIFALILVAGVIMMGLLAAVWLVLLLAPSTTSASNG